MTKKKLNTVGLKSSMILHTKGNARAVYLTHGHMACSVAHAHDAREMNALF